MLVSWCYQSGQHT